MDEAKKWRELSVSLEITSIADQAAAMFCERAFVLDLDLRRQFPVDVTQDADCGRSRGGRHLTGSPNCSRCGLPAVDPSHGGAIHTPLAPARSQE